MAKQLFAHLARTVRGRIWGLTALGLSALALAWIVTAAVSPAPAGCEGICQCWYCPQYSWGDFNGDGKSEFRCDSPCDHGCAGACAYNDATGLGDCSQVPGQGGCGPVCNCRDEDCGGAGVIPPDDPPPVTPTPTPPPTCPPMGKVREQVNLIPPRIEEVTYLPPRPVVVGQDPNRQGFRLRLIATGGRYEFTRQELERWCGPESAGESLGRYPDACGEDAQWHWACPVRCIECYDDPFAVMQVRMRLADPTVDWIQRQLATRYPGARPKEGLPRIWQLAGIDGQMTIDRWWLYAPGQPDVLSPGPVDPGIHGGKIVAWTRGTPKSDPQLVERAFEVPVYLMDTTILR